MNLSRFKIGTKITAFLIISLICLAGEALFTITNIRSELLHGKQTAIRQVVETAHSLLKHHYATSIEGGGTLSLATAQENALAAISKLRYAENEYFWVNDTHPRMVMHPTRPQLNGTDLAKNADPNGKLLFVEMVKTAQDKGAGFVDYMWPKPGQEAPQPKISYVKLFEPWGWIIGSGVYVDDINHALLERLKTVIPPLLAMLVMLALAGTLISRDLKQPITSVAAELTKLRNRDYSSKTEVKHRKDEIGTMLTAVADLRSALKTADEAEEKMARDQQRQLHRAAQVEQASNEFKHSVQTVLEHFSNEVGEMSMVAANMKTISDNTIQVATSVAAAAEQAAANVQTVAAASEELTASIHEISRQVENSQQIASTAVSESRSTNQAVTALSESATKIGQVVQLITDIANQTNLLALNATIEAARAGDAGKGFAVVAGEVKNLASQTAKATADISQQIESMQTATTEAVAAIQQIGSRIEDMNQVATSIAAAIAQQKAATTEISRNVQEASAGTQDVSGNIQSVNSAAVQNGKTADTVLSVSDRLANQRDHLRIIVEGFLHKLQSA